MCALCCTCALHSGVCTARTHCAYVCGADADELRVCAVRVNGARMRREGVTKFLEIGPLRVREWLRWTVCLFANGTAVIMSRCLCAATLHTSRLMGRPSRFQSRHFLGLKG